MIALGNNVHYLEYHKHGRLKKGSYLPPLWNQCFIKKNLANLNTVSHCVDIVEIEAGAFLSLLVKIQM